MDDELKRLDQEIRQCSRCSTVLSLHPENPPFAANPVVPRPVVSAPMQAEVMLIGQAPGLTEYQTGRAFSGQAGAVIRQLFSECGLSAAQFDRIVYQTSAVKCFPGRKQNKGRWEDRPPCGTMREFCFSFLKRQIDLVRPAIVVTLGVVAAQSLDAIRGVGRRTLSDVLGTIDVWEHRSVIYLAHTSRGSRFLNNPANRAKQDRAKGYLAVELARRLSIGA